MEAENHDGYLFGGLTSYKHSMGVINSSGGALASSKVVASPAGGRHV